MHREDPQLRLFIQNNTDYPTYFDYATFNGSTSYIYGLESNISYELSRIFTFNSSLSLLKNHLGIFYFDEDGNGTEEKFGDRIGSHSPMLSLFLNTIINITSNISLSLDANYKDEFYFDEQNDHKSKNYSRAFKYFNHANTQFLGLSICLLIHSPAVFSAPVGGCAYLTA